MLRRIWLILCLAVALNGAVCSAGINDYPTVAVLDFGLKANASPEVILESSAIVTDTVEEMLLDSGRFNIVDRQQIDAVIAEQANGMSGLYDSATAARVGGILGAEYMVVGNVNGLSTRASAVGLTDSRVGSVGNSKQTVAARITVRVIEVATSRVVTMASGCGESSRTGSEFDLSKRRSRRTARIDVYGPDGSHGTIKGETSRTAGNWLTFRIGGYEISQKQVENALIKAATKAIYGEKTGLLAKLDGKNKKPTYKDYLR